MLIKNRFLFGRFHLNDQRALSVSSLLGPARSYRPVTIRDQDRFFSQIHLVVFHKNDYRPVRGGDGATSPSSMTGKHRCGLAFEP